MFETTVLYKQLAEDPLSKLEAKVMIGEVEYGMDTIVRFDIEDSIASDEDFELGGVITSKLELSIKTPDDIPRNAEIAPYVRYSRGLDVTEWIPMGKFYIDTRTFQNGLWNFTCFDRLLVTQQEYRTNLVFPNTAWQMVVEMAYELDFVVSQRLLDDMSISLMFDTKPEGGTYSAREILKFIGSAQGWSLKMNRHGELDYIDFVDRTPVYTVTSDKLVRFEETNPLKLISVLVASSENDEPITIGEGDVENIIYVFNPLMDQTMADQLFEIVNQLEYQPSRIEWRARPDIDVGDFIQVVTRSGTYSTIALRNTFVYSGGCKCITVAPSSSGTQSEFGFGGSIGKTIQQVTQRIGVFSRAINTSRKRVKFSTTQGALMPVTTAGETDIEFTVTISGTSTVDTILNVSFKIAGLDVGKVKRVPIKEGYNFLNFSTLVKRFPKISDWLFCNLSVDNGEFVIEEEDLEFYIFGGNIISGQVRPILEFVAELSGLSNITDNLIVTKTQSETINVTDTLSSESGLIDEVVNVSKEV